MARRKSADREEGGIPVPLRKMRHRMVGAKGLQPFLEALLEEKTGVLHLISYPALFREPGVVAMRFVQC